MAPAFDSVPAVATVREAPERRTATVVPGVRVGHSQAAGRATGVTAILFDDGAPTVVDVRGGASGTFDTASLALDATFGRRWALFFSGGSLFGLDAASGVRRWVLENGGGARAFGNPNRIVPVSGAVLFDLPRVEARIPDYGPLGYRAASGATRGPVPTGRVGAGTGASVGTYLGRARADPGGLGSSGARVPGFGSVGVVAVVNAVGAVRDPSDGRWVSGPRDASGAVVPPGRARGRRARGVPSRGTTLVAVLTDARVDRAVLQRMAVLAHDGLARAVDPAHTPTDGDVVFVSTTERAARPPHETFPGEAADRLGGAAADLVVAAILNAVA
jgi:L-aminopeptidase/D-esterase-like protein